VRQVTSKAPGSLRTPFTHRLWFQAPVFSSVRRRHLSSEVFPRTFSAISRGEQGGFRLAHQTHKDFPLAATLPPKAAHQLGEFELELLRLHLQGRALGTAVIRELRDDLEDFFFALYKVAASLTR
jgi:hypothetical protein